MKVRPPLLLFARPCLYFFALFFGIFSYAHLAGAAFYSHTADFDFSDTVLLNKNGSVIAVHPTNPDILYLGTWGGGILKSTDRGETWTFKNTGLPSLFVDSIEFDPLNPATVYIGLVGHIFSNGGILYKSTDGGGYWEPVPGTISGGTPFNVNPCSWVEDIEVDPTNSERLYFGTAVNACNVRGKLCGGFYRSADGGATFGPNPGCSATHSYGGPNDYLTNDATIVKVNSLRPNEVYAMPGWAHPKDQSVATSFDYGETIHYRDVVDTRGSFLPASEQYVASLMPPFFLLSPQNPDLRYAIHGDQLGGIMRRSDGVVDPVRGSAETNWTIPVPPVVVRWEGDTSESLEDGVGDNDADGENTQDNIWKPVFFLNSLPPAAGGRTTYSGGSLVVGNSGNERLYLATHITPLVSSEAADIWELAPGADPASPWNYRKIYESQKTLADSTPFIQSMTTDSSNPYRIYFIESEKRIFIAGPPTRPSRLRVLESTDQGASWTVRTLHESFSYLHANDIKEFEDVSGARHVFLASTLGLYRLDESATSSSWIPLSYINTTPQGASFATVVQSPRDKNIFYTKAPRFVARSEGGAWFRQIDEIQFGLGRVYSDCSYPFPDPVLTTTVFNALAVDPSVPDAVYAGADDGIWRNTKAKYDWELCNSTYSINDVTQAWQKIQTTGLTNAYILSLEFDPADPTGGTMWAGTRQGIFKSTDHGLLWAVVLPGVRDVRQLAFSGDAILIPTLDGLYRSGDHGASWTRVLMGNANRVSQRKGFPGAWLVATEAGIRKSTDDGETWSSVETPFLGPVDSVLYTTSPFGAERFYYTGPGDALYRTDAFETPPPVITDVEATQIRSTSTIIAWTTDTDSDSQVEYGGTPSYGSRTQADATLTKDHRVLVNNLSPDTLYHYRVRSADALGNPASSLDYTFGTSALPIISNVTVVSITSSTAVISWTTDVDADAQIEYGRTTSYGSSTSLNATLTKTHTATLQNLTFGALYHYRVRSADALGNLAISPDLTFMTLVEVVAGKIGSALSFNGVSSYASLPYMSTFNRKPFTVMAWVKQNVLKQDQPIFSTGDGQYLRVAVRNGKAYFNFYRNEVSPVLLGAKNVEAGEWVHLAFTWEGAGKKRKIYVNGELDVEDAPTSALQIVSGLSTRHGSLGGGWIGRSQVSMAVGFDYYFDGLIDDFRIYNRALTPPEINAYYDATR